MSKEVLEIFNKYHIFTVKIKALGSIDQCLLNSKIKTIQDLTD